MDMWIKNVLKVATKGILNDVETEEIANVMIQELYYGNLLAVHDESCSIRLIEINAICYIEDNETLYTKNGSYKFLNNNLIELLSKFHHDQVNLIQMDRKIIVNFNNIEKFHSDLGHVYFGDPSNDDTLKVQVLMKSTDRLKKLLGKEYDLAVSGSLYSYRGGYKTRHST